VLARLARIPGLLDARVECSGRYFAVELEPSAPEALQAARAALGKSARVLPAAEAATQLAWRARGEPWFDLASIRGLSYVEGRVLASRVATRIREEADLAAEEAEAVGEPVRLALFAALDRVHDEGGRSSSGWLAEAWPEIGADLGRRLEGALPPERVTAVLAAFAGQRPP
jgi:hypothetical protein